MTHQHKAARTIERAYSGSVTSEVGGRYQQNQAAHGNIVVIDTCRCGAERRTNVNQQHVERGRWTEYEER